MKKVITGSLRQYSADDLALFAEWRSVRMDCRPSQCRGGAQCWAELGPPGLGTGPAYRCIGCNGTPRPRHVSLADAR